TLIYASSHPHRIVIPTSSHLSPSPSLFFSFNAPATTEISTLSLHDALPISCASAPCTLRLTSSSVSPISRRRSEWPISTLRQPSSTSIGGAISPVCAPEAS